jgi:hypothetical protein
MRNIVPLSTRRWRLPLVASTPDVVVDPSITNTAVDGASKERVVASCYDGEQHVVYAVTDACNLYGIHTPPTSSTKAAGSGSTASSSSVCLEMSLLGGGDGDDEEEEEEGPALPARSDVVGMEFVIELAAVIIAAASGELLLVEPPPPGAAGWPASPREKFGVFYLPNGARLPGVSLIMRYWHGT